MANAIQKLLQNTLGDGARSSKFECYINFADSDLIEINTNVLVKTAQFPGKSHSVIDLKFKGRTIPVKGQVKYDNTWTCSFYLTEDHGVKKAFEDWIESIDQQHNMSNRLSTEIQNAQTDRYMTDMSISQLDFDGSEEKIEYRLYNVFPKSVSFVDVDYSAVGTMLEITVEFSYSHFDTFKK